MRNFFFNAMHKQNLAKAAYGRKRSKKKRILSFKMDNACFSMQMNGKKRTNSKSKFNQTECIHVIVAQSKNIIL